MKITVRRTGAIGDVLCVTPVIRRLRMQYPDAHIEVQTAFPQIFAGNTDLDPPERPSLSSRGLFVDLDLAYERRPDMHIVDAYFMDAFGDSGDPIDKELWLKPAASWHNPQTAVIHAARSWASRTMPAYLWDGVAILLREQGIKPVFVGAGADYGGPLWATNTLGKLTLPQVASLIRGATIFIGSDSALLHVAGTTITPIVGLYTSVRAKYRLPYRYGELGGGAIAVEPNITCRGCLVRKPAPVTNMTCERGDNLCVHEIDTRMVMQAIRTALSFEPSEYPRSSLLGPIELS